MSLTDQLKRAAKELAWLLEIEIAMRIDDLTWAQVPATDTWYITIPLVEGRPSRVREIYRVFASGSGFPAEHEVTEYAEEATLAGCNGNAGSWYFENGILYVHTTMDEAPDSGDFYIAMYFWKCFCDGQYPAPNELVFSVAPGFPAVWYDPRLQKDSIPDLSMEVTGFQQGGVQQTWGTLKLNNGDGELDAQLFDYIWENKVYVLRVGEPGDAYADFVPVSRGRTGGIAWDDAAVTLGVEDPTRTVD